MHNKIDIFKIPHIKDRGCNINIILDMINMKDNIIFGIDTFF